MSSDQEINKAFGDATQPIDPSVQYAEAFMDGQRDVVVTTRDGQQVTYVFGQEYNR